MNQKRNNKMSKGQKQTATQNNQSEQKPWYIVPGQNEDVIISSRLRVCRNLSASLAFWDTRWNCPT